MFSPVFPLMQVSLLLLFGARQCLSWDEAHWQDYIYVLTCFFVVIVFSFSRKTPREIESQWQMFWFAVLQPLDSFLEDALLADLAAEGVCRVHMPHRKIV